MHWFCVTAIPAIHLLCHYVHSRQKKCVQCFIAGFSAIVGIPSTIRSDCASNFTSSLTTTFLKILGSSPNFNVPWRPQQIGLCKRLIGTMKNLINKVASDNPKYWHKHLGFVLWAIRETPNSTTGLPQHC